ncbi:glycosyltransferase family 2 protein [candidate division WOR-3 bacterium]|nr:glycosyltransferase family 2 protein [candidate division WOR-3 bacterium]
MALPAPAVSVVVPLYNKERHVARAIQSVLNQVFGDFELIVVDDGSTDGSVEVVKTFDEPRIRLVHREHVNSAGGHAARNLGITTARADFIAFLDADDEWLPGHLATLTRLSGKYPQCGAYASGYAVVGPDGRRWVHASDGIPASPWEGVIPSYFRSAPTHPVWTSATAVPKRVFDAVGLFPVGVSQGGDLDMWCRIALAYPICFCTRLGAVYHKDADNRVCLLNRPLCEYGHVRVIRDALRAGSVPPDQQREALEFIAFSQLEIAGRNISAGHHRRARQLLLSCRGTRKYARGWWRLMLQTLLPPGWPARLKAARHTMRNLAGCHE